MEPTRTEEGPPPSPERAEAQARYQFWQAMREGGVADVAAAYLEWESTAEGVPPGPRPQPEDVRDGDESTAVDVILDRVADSIAGRSPIEVVQSRQLLGVVARDPATSPAALLRAADLLDRILEQQPTGAFRTLILVLKRLDEHVSGSDGADLPFGHELHSARDRLVRRAEQQPDGYVVALRRVWLEVLDRAHDETLRRGIEEAQASGPATPMLLMLAMADWVTLVEGRLADAFARNDGQAAQMEAVRLVCVMPGIDHKFLRRTLSAPLSNSAQDPDRILVAYDVIVAVVDAGSEAVADLVPRFVWPPRQWVEMLADDRKELLDAAIARLRDAIESAAERSDEYALVALRLRLSDKAIAGDLDGAFLCFEDLQRRGVVSKHDVGWMITAHTKAPGTRARTLERAFEFACNVLEQELPIGTKSIQRLVLAASRSLASQPDDELQASLERFSRLADEVSTSTDGSSAARDALDLALHEETLRGWRSMAFEVVERARDAIVAVRGGLNDYELTGWVRALVATGDLDRAISELEAVVRGGASLNTFHVTELMRVLSRDGRSEDVERVLALLEGSGGSADAILMGVLITGLANAGRLEDAERVLRSGMPERGIEPDAFHYGTLMHALGRRGRTADVRAMMAEMISAGLTPTERHHQALAIGHAANGEVDETLAVLEASGLARANDGIVLRTISRAFAGRDDPTALLTWADIVSERLSEDPLEFLLPAAEHASPMTTRAMGTFVRMLEERSLRGSPRSLALVCGLGIRTLRSSGPSSAFVVVQHVNDELELLGETGLGNAEIDRLALLVHDTRSVPLARLMLGIERLSDLAPTPFRTGAAMVALSTAGLADECEEILAATRRSVDLQPRDERYLLNLLLAAFRRAGRHDEVARVFREMSSRGLAPDSYTFAEVGASLETAGAFEDEDRSLMSSDASHWGPLIEKLREAITTLEPVVGRLGTVTQSLRLRRDSGLLAESGELVARVGSVVVELGESSAGFRQRSIGAEIGFGDPAVTSIVGDISHELNQPIGRAGVMSDVLQRYLEAGDLENAGKVIDRLIEAVMDVGQRLADYRAAVGGQPDEDATFSAASVIDDVLARLMGRGLLRDVDVEVDVRRDRKFDHALIMRGNRFLFGRALAALVTNAAEAMRESGTEDPRIRISGLYRRPRSSAPNDFGFLELHVVDNGPGIAPDVRRRVFEQGFTTKRGRGLGLGLATVHSVVAAHGGSVVLQEGPGGAAFTIRVPAARPEDDPEALDPIDDHLGDGHDSDAPDPAAGNDRTGQ